MKHLAKVLYIRYLKNITIFSLRYYLILLIFLTTIVYNNLWAQNPHSFKVNPDSIICYAINFEDTPYLYGGNDVNGFDCSGFVSFVFGHFGIITPRSSADYSFFGSSIPIDSCRKGDIILFTGTNLDKSIVGHVGIIISDLNEPIQFIHSSSSKNHWGVTITDYNKSTYPIRFIGLRRIFFWSESHF